MVGFHAPTPSLETAPFWEGVSRRELLVPFCPNCNQWFWPPSCSCVTCRLAAELRAVNGRGKITAYTIVHRPPTKTSGEVPPYILGFVELDVGVRIFSTLIGCSPNPLRIGQSVMVDFIEVEGSDMFLPAFKPIET